MVELHCSIQRPSIDRNQSKAIRNDDERADIGNVLLSIMESWANSILDTNSQTDR